MNTLSRLISETIDSLYGVEITLDITPAPKAELGEYCIGVFPLARPTRKSPPILAEEISQALSTHHEIFTQVNTVGGYVNFSLTDRVWGDIFSQVMRETRLPEKKQETIVVDYIGANVGKPLHIGHICTPSIGQTICNLYQYLGYRVIGDSHFGDWGGIFGKLIYAWRGLLFGFESNYLLKKYPEISEVRKFTIGQQEIWKHKQISNSGVDFLLDLYQTSFLASAKLSQDIDEEFLKKEVGEKKEFQYLSGVGIDLNNPEELKHHKENTELWKLFTSISIAETEKKLDLLNVHATYNIGESFYEGLHLPRPNGEDYPDLQYTMKDIVAELIEKGIAIQNEDGSVGVVFPEETKLPSCILQKRDGTGLYLTSDLACIKYRLTNGWNPSKMIYCVDVRQQTHLRQAFTIARMAWGDQMAGVETLHAFNGFIKLKEGAMSTRHGTVIFLEKLIEEGFDRTKEILLEKGKTLNSGDIQKITIAAIKYSYLMQDREKDVVFDWEKALAFEGHSGPYIQYATVRARKILESAGERMGRDTSLRPSYQEGNQSVLSTHDKTLLQKLSEMDAILEKVAETYKPHHLALYTYELAVCFNSFYVHTPKILDEQDESLKQARLVLIRSTVEKLTLAMNLLGMEIPSEM